MKRYLRFSLLLFSSAGMMARAAEVEMEACHMTPEVKKEMNLTAAQEPKVTKVFAELAPMLEQIEKAKEKRAELRKTGGDSATIDRTTKDLIALENQCRDRLHQLLKPILADSQYAKVLEMEEVHRKKVRERQAASAPAAR